MWCAALLFLGCQPADLSGSVEAYVYRLDSATRAYSLERSAVDNLESLRGLQGRDVSVRAGSELNSGLLDLQVVRGAPFQLEWTADAEGVVQPADLQSLYALSLYRNLDRVAALLRAHGHVPAARLDVFYFPRMDSLVLGDGRAGFTDNAAFVPQANAFLIVPSFVLADVPMFLNEGVMAHEFGHATIHQELFAPTGSHWLENASAASLHEGVADLIGFAATGDPNYIGPTVDIHRDLSVPRDYTDGELDQLLSGGETDPHFHGSVMARAVYELWPKSPEGSISEAERSRMLSVILATLRTIPLADGQLSLASFPNWLVPQLGAEERAAACELLLRRLAPLAAEFTNCEAP